MQKSILCCPWNPESRALEPEMTAGNATLNWNLKSTQRGESIIQDCLWFILGQDGRLESGYLKAIIVLILLFLFRNLPSPDYN